MMVWGRGLAMTGLSMTAWLANGCGRTPLLATDAAETLEIGISTSTATSTATSQPVTDGKCPVGLTACGRGAAIRCYDLGRSVDHCGQCENACAPGIVCESSKCQQYRCKGALTFRGSPTVVTVPSNGAYFVPVLGYFDGDGNLDFVGATGIEASVLLGQGDGTFRAHAVAPDLASAWNAAAADLNGDGRLDLASIAERHSAVTVRLGNGDPNTLFGPATVYPIPSPPGNLLLADLDDDSRVDMVAAEPQRLTLWRGTGDGGFGAPDDLAVGLVAPTPGKSLFPVPIAYSLLAADWNRDGVLDLLFGKSSLRMVLGRGDGTFDQEIACGLAVDVNPSGNIVADFDRDMKPDMAVVGPKVFLGMNGCNFSFSVSLPMPHPASDEYIDSLGVADLDGDGNPDVVSAEMEASSTEPKNHLSVHLGDGHGKFAAPLSFSNSIGLSYSHFLMGDLNHDSKLDIISTGWGVWQVFLNTCP